jgi:hypothetical protein
MATICNPAACAAAVAAVFLSGIGVGLPIDSARAQANCVTAPGATPPEGQHWYYHTDPVKHRKCWYLHAIAPLPTQASADPPAQPSEPASPIATVQSPAAATSQQINATSAAEPATDTAEPASETASTQPAAHWCAYFTGGPTNCDFAVFKDCLEAIKGKTALCVQKAQ